MRALPYDPLGDRIAELSAHLDAAKSRLIALIGEFDEQGGWAADGCRSCAHWLGWKCGVSAVAAREQVRVARALKALPRTREAFASAAVSYSKVRALTRVATPDSERYLLMIAEHGTAAHMERVVRGVRRVRRERELAEANACHEARSLHWNHDDDGMTVVTVRLDAEHGARFIAAVQGAVDAMAREGDGAASASVCSAAGASPPSHAARRADALMRLVDGTNPDTEIVVHVSAEALRGDAGGSCCELEDAAALPAESARRLACDAGIVRLVEAPDGQPLDVGRKTRSIPPSLRRALRSRDGGCRFPGCEARAYVEGHHVHHWARGGETALHNLVSLCRQHHRLVHEGGFSVERRGDGGFRFLRPDGARLVDAAPPARVDGSAADSVLRANRARGLRIDARTGVCKWDGVPMDEAQAVEGALSAAGELAHSSEGAEFPRNRERRAASR